MRRRIILTAVVLLVCLVGGFSYWLRLAVSSQLVRSALAQQLSDGIGQPVSIASIKAALFPRPSIRLTGVTIGTQIAVGDIAVSTSFRGLLARRIEHATLEVNHATVTLPVTPVNRGGGGAAGSASGPVQLVSVDEIVLHDVRIVSRGRTLTGEIAVVPHGTTAATIRRMALTADGAQLNGYGEIQDLVGPRGAFDITAGLLDFDQLIAFAAEFAAGSNRSPATGIDATSSSGMTSGLDLTMTLHAARATFARADLEQLTARARLRSGELEVQPLTFGLFGGSYDGRFRADLTAEQTFNWEASLTDIDMSAVAAFAGKPGVLTGRLRAAIDLTGQGSDSATALKTARGNAYVAITNGVVKNLSLVRTAVAVVSQDEDAAVEASQRSRDEPFSEFVATLLVSDGQANAHDLRFVSDDIQMEGSGGLALDGSTVDLRGEVHLSEALSRQLSSKVAHLGSHQGRISLPMSVTGAAGRYSVGVDRGTLLRRAATGSVLKGLGKLVGR